MCLILLACINFLNSSLVKDGLLSDTIVHGSPCVEKTNLNFSTVFEVDIDQMICTSNHFECESIMIRYM